MNSIIENKNDSEWLWQFIKSELEKGVNDRHHPLRQLQLATTGGAYPEIRTIVFRQVHFDPLLVIFHTDTRSPKYQQILHNPQVSVLGYNHDLKYQVRMRGIVKPFSDPSEIQRRWAKIGVSSRRCYMTQQAPGSHMSEPSAGLPSELLSRAPTAEESEPFIKNYAPMKIHIIELEWLFLCAKGHRRGVYKLNEDRPGSPKIQWLSP